MKWFLVYIWGNFMISYDGDIVEKIYNLIKEDSSPNTFYNNLDLFEYFYRHEMNLLYGNKKILDIYKYLVTIDVDVERFPTLKYHIFTDFERYAQMYTYKFYDIKKSENPELQIDGLFKLIDSYRYLKQFDKENMMYNEITFLRDCTCSMILSLNKDFFQLSSDTIKKLISNVKNNSYLNYLINQQQMNCLLDKDYIFQYVDKFLASQIFVSPDSIADDELLKALFDGKIKKTEIVEYFFKKINATVLLQFLGGDFSKVIDLFDSINLDEVKRKIIFNKFLKDEVFDKTNIFLIKFLAHDKRAEFYINDLMKEKLINHFTLTDYYSFHDDETINYLIDNSNSPLFKMNLLENLKKNSWNQKTIDRIKEIIKNLPRRLYSYDEAVAVFNNIFKGAYKFNDGNRIRATKAIRTIVYNLLGDDNIPVYFFYDSEEITCGAEEDYTLRFNLRYIDKLFDYQKIEIIPNKARIIATIFHECRHYMQFKNTLEEEMSEVGYKTALEDLLGNLVSNYYDDNYISIFYEQDARIFGNSKAAEFIRNNFSYLPNCIEYFTLKAKKEEVKKYETREIFSDAVSVDDAISKLILINPSIVKKYSFLQREYNIDGTKKKKNNILD